MILNSRVLIAMLITACPCLAEAGKSSTPCVPIPGQYRRVQIPLGLGKLLLEQDRSEDPDLLLALAARGLKSPDPDPNVLYSAYLFDLNSRKFLYPNIEYYLVRTRPDGPRAITYNLPAWVVRGSNGKWDILLHGYAQQYGGPIALKSSHNGLLDICTIASSSMKEKYITIHWYNGGMYVPGECRAAIIEEGGDEEVKSVSCDRPR